MPSYNIELNNKPIAGTKKHTLLLRITVERKHARIKLDYAITNSQFNPKPQNNKYVRQNHSKHKTINEYLDDKIQEAKNVAKAISDEGKLVTANSIKQKMISPKSQSFTEFTKARIAEMTKNYEVANAERYGVLLNKVEKFQNKSEILFSEIDHSFLRRFQAYLKKLGNSDNTIHANFRIIRAIIYKAIEIGSVKREHNPFLSFKLKEGEVTRSRLSLEEVKSIEELNLPTHSLIWHVRNAFMFSFYCAGIRASDILQLRWKNIVDGRLVYQMHKTNRPHSLKLIEKAETILDLYENTGPDEYIFPFFNTEEDYSDPSYRFNRIGAKTALMNKYLKIIAEKAGIDKKISTHTARHSFADIARQRTDNIYNLSKTLGHSSIKITEAYLASFDEKAVDDTLDEVFK